MHLRIDSSEFKALLSKASIPYSAFCDAGPNLQSNILALLDRLLSRLLSDEIRVLFTGRANEVMFCIVRDSLVPLSKVLRERLLLLVRASPPLLIEDRWRQGG